MDDHINAAKAERRKVIKALAAEFAGSAEAEALEAARTASWKKIAKEHYPDNVPEDVEKSFKDIPHEHQHKVLPRELLRKMSLNLAVMKQRRAKPRARRQRTRRKRGGRGAASPSRRAAARRPGSISAAS